MLLGIPYTHISSPMPDFYRHLKPLPRGVANRRAAINWIRQSGKKTGVLYFGDDDNTFDLRLFDEIRYTKRVSMFPVGLIGDYSISSPVVRNVSSIESEFKWNYSTFRVNYSLFTCSQPFYSINFTFYFRAE